MKKRMLALLMTIVMSLSLLPMSMLATGGESPPPEEPLPTFVAKIGDIEYPTLKKAVNAAKSGDIITLGVGKYTLYNESADERADTKNKNLTFVGQGPDKTAWGIGATVPNPDNFGTEYNGDYSFDGAGTITFKNMTLQSGSADYLGFIRAANTIVENCTINGKTFYWGYTSATFKNTTFNAPEGDYAIWTYCSPIMTFEGCTFNSSGKTINVYTDYSAGKYDITVNYKNCTVNGNTPNDKKDKAVMNINDSNMGNYKYNINISGDNVVNGVTADNITCSRLFGFSKTGNNSGRSDVTINNVNVWEGGERVVDHNCDRIAGGSYINGVVGANNAQYTDGYKDNAFVVVEKTENGIHTITKTCQYCGYTETMTEVDWDFSKSKEATKLDSKYESTVTLSLPSAEETLSSDIVFVVDKSDCIEATVKQAEKLVRDMKDKIPQNTSLNVGVVVFAGDAKVSLPLTSYKEALQPAEEGSEITKLAAAINASGLMGSTNMEAGLKVADEILKEHSEVQNNRKYVILISDGLPRTFNSGDENNETYNIYVEYNIPNIGSYCGEMSSWCILNSFGDGVYNIPGGSWNTYFENVTTHVKADGDKYALLYNKYGNGFSELPEGYSPISSADAKKHALNVDRAIYDAYVYYKGMPYNCYAVCAGSSELGQAFMSALNNGKTLDFATIQDDILYLLGPGSTIVDEIGNTSDYNFDLVIPKDESPFTLTVGGVEYTAEAGGTNAWDFYAPASAVEEVISDAVAPPDFRVVYENEGTEKFTWYINTNISNFSTVQLTYTVKLTNPKTVPGTYGEYDKYGKYGSAGKSGLYTNNSAVLYPLDSQGNSNYLPDEFLKPTVSYTVSGGHNGGGNTKPPVLNKEDHYAYIVGYPDGTVKPQGNITRAEVATIFFRMLTDDSRNEFWSQTNSYSDVSEGQWFNNAISTLANAGILSGYPDGTFRPNAPITRAEFTKIAASFFERVEYTIDNPFNDVDDDDWFYKFVMAAYEGGLITGYPEGDFRPNANISRAESVTIVNRTLERAPDADHFLKDMIVWPDNAENAWYYEAVQEATNSHEYVVKGTGTNKYEEWTKILEVRDWPALEKEWSNANSATGGEVVK